METANRPTTHRLLLICLLINIFFLGLLICPSTPGALSHSCVFCQLLGFRQALLNKACETKCQAEKRAELTKANAKEISGDNPLENDQHFREELRNRCMRSNLSLRLSTEKMLSCYLLIILSQIKPNHHVQIKNAEKTSED
ncbi:hypothetical protein Nepgr_025102 [Nepenthes gracilis]|uniref:Uncharacterized protein n=1 Tax=Nepenthes gracilis TaxID=150966 RepID=A0AAD3T5M7_NEPGR|nr:hypothetical protein Nepgr_025102 [Nepenthes gracilis]